MQCQARSSRHGWSPGDAAKIAAAVVARPSLRLDVDNALGRALPIDLAVRGNTGRRPRIRSHRSGAFAHPDEAGDGEYLPLGRDFLRFNEIDDTLNRRGNVGTDSKLERLAIVGYVVVGISLVALLLAFCDQ